MKQQKENQIVDKNKLWRKIKRYGKQIGTKTIYSALLMYYAFQRKETPAWAKHIILGALGYLIAPIDGIPDLTPIIGYTDDIGILSFGLVTIAAYVNEEVRGKARKQLGQWFGQVNEEDLEAVEKQL